MVEEEEEEEEEQHNVSKPAGELKLEPELAVEKKDVIMEEEQQQEEKEEEEEENPSEAVGASPGAELAPEPSRPSGPPTPPVQEDAWDPPESNDPILVEPASPRTDKSNGPTGKGLFIQSLAKHYFGCSPFTELYSPFWPLHCTLWF